MLIGLAAKNAILIVEFAKAEYERGGKTLEDAALTGARIRLRPILMTAFAFILGCVPLWIATGSGRGFPANPGHGRHRRNAGGVAACDLPDPGNVRCGGADLATVLPQAARHAQAGHARDWSRFGENGAGAMKRAVVAGLAALLAGCTVGPNYQRPPLDVPQSFRNAGSPKGLAGDASIGIGKMVGPFFRTRSCRS